MKCRVCTLILMLLMCWASQSSAQPTRAAQAKQKTITPNIVKRVNRNLTEVCTWVEHPNYQGDRNKLLALVISPAITVNASLVGLFDIALSGDTQTRVLKQPKHGKVVSAGVEVIDTDVSSKVVYKYKAEGFKYNPDDSFKYDPVKNGNLLGEDHVTFEVVAQNRKFIVRYVIKVVIAEGYECHEGIPDDASNKGVDVQLVLDSITEEAA